jgi:hypothetical protein
VGYCTLSEKGLILEANLAAAALLGVDPQRAGQAADVPAVRFSKTQDQDIY